MGAITASKTKLSVGGTTACDTVSEYDALTWVAVSDVTNYGEFGPQYQEITYTPIETGVVKRLKGALDNGNLQLELARNPDDAGQADLIEALASYDNINVKVELNDKPTGAGAKPTRFFFPCKVMAYRPVIGDGNRVVGATVQLGIDGDVLEGAKAAGT